MAVISVGYARIRRGLLDHMPRITPIELKVYLILHLVCDWSHGTYTGTISDLAEITGHCPGVVGRALASLSTETGERQAYIDYTPAVNQWTPASVRIRNY